MEVLDRIEQALRESLDRAAALETGPEAPGGAAHAAKLALDQLAERQGRLQAILDRTEQDATRAEAALAAEVEEIERWLREGRAARERVVGQAGSAV
jgi:hypothetical protein